MVKVRSFSFTTKEEESIIDHADRIAKRERKTFSKIVLEGMKNTVIAHEKGNNQFTLETSSQEGFIALPTIGEPLTPKFAQMPDDEFELIGKSLKARLEEYVHEEKGRNLKNMMREIGKI